MFKALLINSENDKPRISEISEDILRQDGVLVKVEYSTLTSTPSRLITSSDNSDIRGLSFSLLISKALNIEFFLNCRKLHKEANTL